MKIGNCSKCGGDIIHNPDGQTHAKCKDCGAIAINPVVETQHPMNEVPESNSGSGQLLNE